MAREERLIANNKKAYHDYFVEEALETGIELSGTEVKSLRENKASLRDTYASIRKGEVWLHGVHIAPYSHGNRSNLDPVRPRKLLLHKKQIRELVAKTKEKGFTLVPLKMYFTESNLVKVELGLVRGKKLYDKRADIASKDQKRDLDRALRERQKGNYRPLVAARGMPFAALRSPRHGAGILFKRFSGPRHLDTSTPPHMGATGFDTIVLTEEAGRGLLAALNRGKRLLTGENNYALAA